MRFMIRCDVPTILVAADSAGCAEARSLLGEVPTVAVKESMGPTAGVCYPTARTREWLRDGAMRAVEAIRGIHPIRLGTGAKALGIRLARGEFSEHVRHRLAGSVRDEAWLEIKAPTLADAWHQYLAARP